MYNYEEIFKAIIPNGDKIALGCPDEQMDMLRGLADYINAQEGWDAKFDDDILLINKKEEESI